MRIHYMSDVHLEFGALDKPLPEGDVVVLAGDITLLAALDPAKADPRARRVREATHSFFEAVAKSFRKVIYLMGNHEHYGFCIDDSAEAVRRHLPGVTLLENEHLVLGDTILCGATLWTDMGGGDPLKEQAVQRGMSDFYVIEKRDGERLRAFRPADARAMFLASLAYIGGLADANRGSKLVVATHHAPSKEGTAPRQRTHNMDPAYFTDLTAFIQERPNIGVWLHGHTHVQTEYAIGHCRVLSNARGYFGRERSAAHFDPDRWFEI